MYRHETKLKSLSHTFFDKLLSFSLKYMNGGNIASLVFQLNTEH